MRWWWIVPGVLALLAVTGLALRYWMSLPFYRPGGLASRGDELMPYRGGQVEPGFWQVTRDIRLRQFSVGQGSALLVVHGGPGRPPQAPWKVADMLGPNHRVYFYHQRGCGESTRPVNQPVGKNMYKKMEAVEGELGLGAQIMDIERIRRILGEEKVVLVGHSFGGLIASLYAAEFSERVKALILIAPAPMVEFPKSGPNLLSLIKARLSPAMEEEYQNYLNRYFDFPTLMAMNEAGLSSFYDQFAGYYFAAIGKQSAPKAYAPGATGGWSTLAAYLSMGRRHDYSPALKKVGAPVLVIHGRDDLLPVSDSQQFQRYFSNARLEVVDGAGHFVFDDRPEELARRVETFLAGI